VPRDVSGHFFPDGIISGQAIDHGQQSDTVGRGQQSTFNKGILHVDIDECGFRGDELIFGHVVNLRCEGYLRHSYNGHKGDLVFRILSLDLDQGMDTSPAAAPIMPVRPTLQSR
jgi:hypothetical protein